MTYKLKMPIGVPSDKIVGETQDQYSARKSQSAKLPPLEPFIEKCGKGTAYYRSMIEDSMREYGQLCRQEALEEAAKACRETAMPGERNTTQYRDGYIDGFNRGADQCERTIRSLK